MRRLLTSRMIEQDRFFRQRLIEGLHNGAKILLAHFHLCNKGSHPFTIDWSSPGQTATVKLDAEQVNFMRFTTVEIKKKG